MLLVLVLFFPNIVFSCCSSADDVATPPPYKVTVLCPRGYDTVDCVVKTKEQVDIKDVKQKIIAQFKLDALGVNDFAFYCFETDRYYYENCILPPNCKYALLQAFDMLTTCNASKRKVRRPFSLIVPEMSATLSRFVLDHTAVLGVESAKMPESPILLLANQERDTLSDISDVAFDHTRSAPQTVNHHI